MKQFWDIRAQYHIEFRLSFLKNDVYIVKKKKKNLPPPLMSPWVLRLEPSARGFLSETLDVGDTWASSSLLSWPQFSP